MFSSATFHLPIGYAACSSERACLHLATVFGRDSDAGQGRVSFFFGDRPKDRTLAHSLADRINATLLDHKRTVDRALLAHTTAHEIQVPFDEIHVPGLCGVVSFILVVQATDLDNCVSTDVLSGEGTSDTWTSVPSIDLRNVFFAHADAHRTYVEGVIADELATAQGFRQAAE